MHRRDSFVLASSQRGVTLLVGMIMLLLVTLLVLASFHLGRTNLEIVNNAQQRADNLAGAQRIIEEAFTSPLLTQAPATIFQTPCSGFPNNTLCYDVNGDGKNDVVAQITPVPACVKSQPIPNSALNQQDPNDTQCNWPPDQMCFGIGGDCDISRCANTVWDVRAVSQNLDATGTKPAPQGPTAVVNQGVAVRVGLDEAAKTCP